MATRGVIARPREDGFTGRYHHWDSYPFGLGKALYQLYNERFRNNLEGMLELLLDQHPAGWSTIVDRHWDMEPGYPSREEDSAPYESGIRRPACYCHGTRSEKAQELDETNASGCGCEYAYVLAMKDGEPWMTIYTSFCDPGDQHAGRKMVGAFGYGDENGVWLPVAQVHLNGFEPDWEWVDEEANQLPRPGRPILVVNAPPPARAPAEN